MMKGAGEMVQTKEPIIVPFSKFELEVREGIAAWSRPATDHEQVSARADQAVFGLHAPEGGEELRALPRVFEPGIKIRYSPGRSLDTNERFDRESSLLHLASQFFGEVEVSSGEPFQPFGGVTVLPPPRTSRSTIASNSGSNRKPRRRPSMVEAKREIAAATTTPPGRTTRQASRRAWMRSSRKVRW